MPLREVAYRLVLRLHPPRFRETYADDMMQCFRDAWVAEAEGRPLRTRARVCARLLGASGEAGYARESGGDVPGAVAKDA